MLTHRSLSKCPFPGEAPPWFAERRRTGGSGGLRPHSSHGPEGVGESGAEAAGTSWSSEVTGWWLVDNSGLIVVNTVMRYLVGGLEHVLIFPFSWEK